MERLRQTLALIRLENCDSDTHLTLCRGERSWTIPRLVYSHEAALHDPLICPHVSLRLCFGRYLENVDPQFCMRNNINY